MAHHDHSHLKSQLEASKSILILLPSQPKFDSVATALSLKLALEPLKKQVSVACPDPITVEFNRLVGVESISDDIGSSNLVISFEAQSELVDSVSYDLDKGNLRLVITPKPNTPKIDHRQIKFTPAGSKPDLILTIDVDHLDQLKHLKDKLSDSFKNAQVAGMHLLQPAVQFTNIHLHYPGSSSLSEVGVGLLEFSGLPIAEDIATNLYMGLTSATNNFTSDQVTHETFEAAALLLRRGARRDQQLHAQNFPPGSIPNEPLTSFTSPAPNQPTAQSDQPSAFMGYGTDSSDIPSADTPTNEPVKNPPTDWFEPKIYRGPMLQ